jgi:hypothetical protein
VLRETESYGVLRPKTGGAAGDGAGAGADGGADGGAGGQAGWSLLLAGEGRVAVRSGTIEAMFSHHACVAPEELWI